MIPFLGHPEIRKIRKTRKKEKEKRKRKKKEKNGCYFLTLKT